MTPSAVTSLKRKRLKKIANKRPQAKLVDIQEELEEEEDQEEGKSAKEQHADAVEHEEQGDAVALDATTS